MKSYHVDLRCNCSVLLFSFLWDNCCSVAVPIRPESRKYSLQNTRSENEGKGSVASSFHAAVACCFCYHDSPPPPPLRRRRLLLLLILMLLLRLPGLLTVVCALFSGPRAVLVGLAVSALAPQFRHLALWLVQLRDMR